MIQSVVTRRELGDECIVRVHVGEGLKQVADQIDVVLVLSTEKSALLANISFVGFPGVDQDTMEMMPLFSWAQIPDGYVSVRELFESEDDEDPVELRACRAAARLLTARYAIRLEKASRFSNTLRFKMVVGHQVHCADFEYDPELHGSLIQLV